MTGATESRVFVQELQASLLYVEAMLFTGIKDMFEAVKAQQKQEKESEFRGRGRISIGSLGSGERSGTWKHTALWSDMAK